MGRAGRAFGSLCHLAVAANNPVRNVADVVGAADFEVWIGQKVGHYGNAVDQCIGIGVAQTDVHELQRRSGAVGDECVTIMLKHNRVRVERSGVWRRYGVVDEDGVTTHLNTQLERTAGRLTEDTRIKFEEITTPHNSGKALRKRRALGVVTNAERGGVGPICRPFRDGMDVTGTAYGPVS